MLAKLLPLFLLFTGMAMAETRTYLVLRQQYFPDDKYPLSASPQERKYFIDGGKKNIDNAGGQPFRLTDYRISADGKYALWNVTLNEGAEKNDIEKLQAKGWVVLISSADVIEAYDPRLGGKQRVYVETQLTSMPTDFYEIVPSTEPT